MLWLIKGTSIIESGSNLKTPAKKLGEAKSFVYLCINKDMNNEELYRKLRAIQELLDEDVREAKRELEYLIQEVHGVTKTR